MFALILIPLAAVIVFLIGLGPGAPLVLGIAAIYLAYLIFGWTPFVMAGAAVGAIIIVIAMLVIDQDAKSRARQKALRDMRAAEPNRPLVDIVNELHDQGRW